MGKYFLYGFVTAAAALVVLVTVFGETKPYKPTEADEIPLNFPEALSDCHMFRVYGKQPGYGPMLITRCPNSATTTDYGKNGKTTTIEKDAK